MWSVRTAVKHVAVRTCAIRSTAVGTCCTNLELANHNADLKSSHTSAPVCVIDRPERASSARSFSSSTLFLHSRKLSSHVNSNSTDKEFEKLEGFSDLDDDAEGKNVDDEMVYESDDNLSDDEEENTLEDEEENTLEEEEELIKKSRVSKRHELTLFELIFMSPRHTMEEVFQKWIKEGNEIKKEDVIAALRQLRRKKLFAKAFEFMNWLEKSKHYEFTDMEYSSLVGLHAKVHGLYQAEKFIEEIPQSLRTLNVYQSLLASCSSMMNIPKTEKVFYRMQDMNFPLTTFTCNTLLRLYKKTDKKKIADVLLIMRKENVKPDLITYQLLIDTKGVVGDIPGIEQLLDTMKEDGIEPDMYTRYLVAKYYIRGGFTKKGEKIAREIEGGDLSDKLLARKLLWNLYAELGMPEEVQRIWKACGVRPSLYESIAVMLTWAKLGKIELAEQLFDKMSKQYKKLPQSCYNSLLCVYVENKMLDKAKDLVKQMSDDRFKIGVEALHMLVRFYVEEGDVAKADSMLQIWVHKNHKMKMQIKPLYETYIHLLEAYAKKGDYHNAEKMFYLTRQMGYSVRFKMYELLLGAYANAKVPAYGFRDRLRADNIFLKRVLSEQLLAVDPFKRAPVTDVLE